MKDLPKLDGSNSLFFPGLPSLGATAAATTPIRAPFAPHSVAANTPKVNINEKIITNRSQFLLKKLINLLRS